MLVVTGSCESRLADGRRFAAVDPGWNEMPIYSVRHVTT